MKKEKLLAVTIAAAMATTVFANGGKEDAVAKSDEPVTLTCFVHTRPNVDNYDDNAMTKWVEEQCNVNLEFIMVNEAEAQTKLNLLLSTGDYPDLLLTKQLDLGSQAIYGAQGILLPLNDLIAKYSPNSQQVFKDYPQANDIYTLADGNIYNLPQISDCVHMKSNQKYWINKVWLDKLGLDMPTTTDEFEKVLIAFRDEDPNGNGIKDEIPLAGATQGWVTQVESFLMNSFVYCHTQQTVARGYVKDGEVAMSFMQPEWKEGLKYLRKLNKEGLLASESFTQNAQGLKQMGVNPGVEILGCFPGGSPNCGINASGDRLADYVALEPLKGPDGVQLAMYNPYQILQPGLSITDHCENVEAAMRVADLLYTPEATMFNHIGREGYEWEKVSEGKGIDGRPATWSRLAADAEIETNKYWNQMGNECQSADLRLGSLVNPDQPLEPMLYNETKDKYLKHCPPIEDVLPPMIFTAEQSEVYVPIFTSITSYVEEYLAKSVVTDTDIDATWDAYINKIKDMGYDQMMDILNDVYQTSK